MASPRQLVAGFGRFWWDFLVGENPDAFIGTLVIIGVACSPCVTNAPRRVIVLPLLALSFLLVSTYRGRLRS